MIIIGFNFKYIMNEFHSKNEIKITFNIEKEDVGKKIYYMYNISKNKDENNYLGNKEPNLILQEQNPWKYITIFSAIIILKYI